MTKIRRFIALEVKKLNIWNEEVNILDKNVEGCYTIAQKL